MNQLATVIGAVPFYLVGTFPTGLLVARLHGIDITSHGSGNVGATNIARVIGKRAGVLTLIGDALKGFLGVCVAQLVSHDVEFAAAAAAAVVCGHCFSIPPYFKGGKGVATALGALLALQPWCALLGIAVFACSFAFSRIVSLSSILAALAAPIGAFLLNEPEPVSLAVVIVSGVVIIRHRENIQRLIEGREARFEAKK